jgi:outer membrane protein assembly factor BamB
MSKNFSKQKFARWVLIIIVSLLMLAVIIIGAFPDIMLQTRCASGADTTSKGRDIIESNIKYVHLWDYQTTFIYSDSFNTSSDVILFAEGDCYRIVALDIETGDTKWIYSSYDSPNSIAVDVNRGNIYAELRTRELVALNEDGVKIWRNNILRGQRGGFTPYMMSTGDLIASISLRGFVKINSETGDIGEGISLPDNSYLVSGDRFWRMNNNQLIAHYLHPTAEVWRSEYQGFTACCLEQVEITSDHILLNFSSNVIALDKETGTLVWQTSTEQVVSNFVVQNDKVIFLDVDATLHIVEESSGNTFATIQFAPPFANARDIANSGNVIGSSLLVSIEDMVAIYFGDTNMISVYRLEINNPSQP